MACPRCSGDQISFSVPDRYRRFIDAAVSDGQTDEDGSQLTVCRRCLDVCRYGGDDDSAESPDFRRIDPSFPTDTELAILLTLLLGSLHSLATNREEILSLVEAIERGGADPLLVIDRLVRSDGIDPTIDLKRRRHQLEQLLG